MLTTTIVLFVVAALLGLAVARQILSKKPTAKGVVIAHGAFGAAGLIALIFHAASNPHRLLTTAIILLAVAALGGLIVFVNDLRGKVGPLGLIVVHALVAAAAVALVLVVAIK